MKKNILIGLIVVVALAGAVYVVLGRSPSSTQQPSQSSSGFTESNAQASATITYTDNGFEPGSVTVKVGDTIAIKNNSSSNLQFESDPHPVHTDDPELNVGSVAPGSSMSFKVTTKGTHGYHNHLNPNQRGTIITE
jgi:plastocyanin